MATTIQKPFTPRVAYHPGVTLAEKLEELGMSVKEFALRVTKPEKTIIAVLKGSSALTPDMAVAFESVTGIPAHFWMQKQQKYNEYVARLKREKALEESVAWSKQFPLSEMQKRGWLKPEDKTPQAKVIALFSFFAVSSKEAWEDYYFNQQLKVAFRISLSQTKNPYAVSAWLRRGEHQVTSIPSLSEYSSDMRDILAKCDEEDERAILAKNKFVRRVVDYIGSYYLLLGGVDMIVFTAGVGENSVPVRREICEKLSTIGVKINLDENQKRSEFVKLSTDESSVLVYVIPTNEELVIARDSYELVRNGI